MPDEPAAAPTAEPDSPSARRVRSLRRARAPGEVDPDAGQQVASLLTPVAITMALVVALVYSLNERSKITGGLSAVMVYHERADDTLATKAGGAVLNSLAVVVALFVATTGIYLLYRFRCTWFIYGWLIISVLMLLYALGSFAAYLLLEAWRVPVDAISFHLAMYNFSAVGTLLVFWTEFGCGPHAPMLLKQGYLVVTSALLAWSTTQMPEWSTWAILAGVSLWDILAVSAGAAAAPPCAPTPRPCLRRCAFGTARSV